MTLEEIERMVSGDSARCEEAIAQIRLWAAIAKDAERQDAEIANRDAQWARAVRDVMIDVDAHHEDESDDPRFLRDCLIRTRLGASAERQCVASRSAVVDMYDEVRPTGEKSTRFVVSVPTGDLGEVREVARAAFAAWIMAGRDITKALEQLQEANPDPGLDSPSDPV